MLVIQEVIGHSVPQKAKQSAVAPPPRQIHIIVAQVLQLLAKLLPHPLVQRQHHGHLHTLRRNSGGQRAGDVGQSPCFAEGHGLAGRIQNFHGSFPFPFSQHRSEEADPPGVCVLHAGTLSQYQGVRGVTDQGPVRQHLYPFIRDDISKIRVAADHRVPEQHAVAHPRALLHRNAGE